jgi:hypothetical protein
VADHEPPRARPPDPLPGDAPSLARRLLVLACSARKRKDTGPLPALERYDGPAFRVLRKFRAGAADPPDVLVLSAKYGLVPSAREIPHYDTCMTPELAGEMRADVLRVLGEAVARGGHAEVAFCLGAAYRAAVAGFEPAGVTVTFVTGTQGSRLRNLRAWLERK